MNYAKFLEKWKEIALLGHTAGLLVWDQETYMPKGESESRAEQMELVASLVHERLVDSELYDILRRLEAEKFSEPVMAANIREALKSVNFARALPADLVAALAKETSLAGEVWQKARKENSFKDFAPALKNIVKLLREEAAAYMAAGIGSSLYEALFFESEDGIAMAEVDAIFNKLRAELPPLVKTVLSLEPPDDSFLFKYYPEELQEKVSREIVTAMGLDWNSCRLDISTHPFTCSTAYTSPRITYRFDEYNLTNALFSVIHEAGHALYEQGLPKEWAYQPIGDACGMSVHESQSRFWEAWLGRSYYFWIIFYPKLRDNFPEQLYGITEYDFYRAINRAKPGFIRTDSDPLTYNLHILLRYDIEKIMINDEVSVDELPSVWNELFKKYFGLDVPDDRQGVLQDSHWSCGEIGYFPTYTLGNIISAQLYEKMSAHVGLWCSATQNSGFYEIKKWLKEKIYQHGSFYKMQELVKNAAGQTISADVFMTQLRKRYIQVYNVSLS